MATLGSWVRGCMQDPRRCTGQGASYCRVDGRCNNESRPMGLLDPASPTHRDRALCFAEAKAAFEACDNAPRGWTVAASFVDAGGTQLARYPACRVEGPCLQAAAGFVRALLLTEDEPTCLAQAEAAHGECGNSSALPLTATFFSPEKVATRTFPGR
jgi:hypothetical protein